MVTTLKIYKVPSQNKRQVEDLHERVGRPTAIMLRFAHRIENLRSHHPPAAILAHRA